jgi:hypothetical protein
MRKTSVLAGCLLIVTLLSQLQGVVAVAASVEGTVIFTLDVCDRSGSSLSSNHELVYLCKSPYTFVPLKFAGFPSIENTVFSPILIPFQLERPPEV